MYSHYELAGRSPSPARSDDSKISITRHQSGSSQTTFVENYHLSTAQTPAPRTPTPTPTIASNKSTPPRIKGNVVSPPYGVENSASFRAPLTAANIRVKDNLERVPRHLSQDVRSHDTRSVYSSAPSVLSTGSTHSTASAPSILTQHSTHSAYTVTARTLSVQSNEAGTLHVCIILFQQKTFL